MSLDEKLNEIQQPTEAAPVEIHDASSLVVSSNAPENVQPVSQGQYITPLDWPDDFSHENGNYNCHCVDCGKTFVGHKRRVQCKLCAEKTSSQRQSDTPDTDAQSAGWWNHPGLPSFCAVNIDFARTLERQRNATRAELAREKALRKGIEDAAYYATACLTQSEESRLAANARAEKAEKECAEWQSRWGAKDTEWLNMKNERDEARAQLAEADAKLESTVDIGLGKEPQPILYGTKESAKLALSLVESLRANLTASESRVKELEAECGRMQDEIRHVCQVVINATQKVGVGPAHAYIVAKQTLAEMSDTPGCDKRSLSIRVIEKRAIYGGGQKLAYALKLISLLLWISIIFASLVLAFSID